MQRSWLEVEDIDPDTGELLGTHLQPIDADGEPVGEPIDPATEPAARLAPAVIKSPRQLRIGVIVPLSSLLGLSDAPGELADRSGLIPGQVLREAIADALDGESRDEVVFTRLLTDDGGRLMDTTELGRYPSARLAQAIRVRAATAASPPATSPPTAAILITTNPGRTERHRPTISIRYAGATTAAKPSPGWPASRRRHGRLDHARRPPLSMCR